MRVADGGADGEVVGDGSVEGEGIVLGGCGAADVGVITADVEAGAQRKLLLAST